MKRFSAIVEVRFAKHFKRYHGVRIVPIEGTFADAKSARTHLHVQHGKVLLVVPSSDAHRVVSESNFALISGNGAP